MDEQSKILITLELSEEQALDYAQFLERISFFEYRNLATSESEAYSMMYAGEKIRNELTKAGFAP